MPSRGTDFASGPLQPRTLRNHLQTAVVVRCITEEARLIRSCIAELKDDVRASGLCPFCDLPWICFAGLAYLGKSCLLHHYRLPRKTFLDAESEALCNCPHCTHTRNQKWAA